MVGETGIPTTTLNVKKNGAKPLRLDSLLCFCGQHRTVRLIRRVSKVCCHWRGKGLDCATIGERHSMLHHFLCVSHSKRLSFRHLRLYELLGSSSISGQPQGHSNWRQKARQSSSYIRVALGRRKGGLADKGRQVKVKSKGRKGLEGQAEAAAKQMEVKLTQS